MHAQTLESAIKKTDNERFDLATGEFKALIAKEPTKAEYYFYYGENYFQADNLDSAKIIWEKGLSLNPACLLNQVGVGKSLWYAGDTAAANKMFTASLLTSKNKNAEIIRQIGAVYVYAPIKNLNKAVTLLTAATKLENKNIEGHLLLGDAQLELNPTNGTEAMKSYNAALDISKSAKIIVRKAKVYQRAKNYELANDMYKEAQELDPTYAPSFR
jgi:tetratricopeptide (TPR) repeat protein